MRDMTLRPWRESDIPAVVRYADNSRIAANLRDVFPFPYHPEDADWFVRDCMERDGRGVLFRAIDLDGQAVGSISVAVGADVYRRGGELGYWLGEPFWGRGIMTEAVGRICREAFSTFDLVRIYAEPYAENFGSRRVLEKAGFRLEGILRQRVCKQGRLLDSCVYALLRQELPEGFPGEWR